MNSLNHHHAAKQSSVLHTLPPFFDPLKHDLQIVLNKMRAAARIKLELLDEALSYVVAVGGKLIRPALAITVANIYRATDEKVISLAASIEMLHTATLVHDDMIDEAARRRGNPTLHTMLNPSSAVLLGDYLFAQAASWSAETDNIEVVRIFSDTLMTIVQGELRQMWAQFNLERANEDYFARIYGKTGALFAAACKAAAELGNAPSQEIAALGEYGRLLGLAFQIVDDVLDYTGNASQMGKPIGADLRNGNITLPVILYLRNYDQEGLAESLFQEKLAPYHAEQIINRVVASPALQDSLQEAQALVDKGKELLNLLPQSSQVERLCELGDYIVRRTI